MDLLDECNGDDEHDKWLYFDYHKNTDDLPEFLDDSSIDAYVLLT